MAGYVDNRFSEKTDVWSLGITIWEIWSEGKIPYFDILEEDLVTHVLGGGRPSREHIEGGCPDDVWQIITVCVDKDPKRRPRFSELLPMLMLSVNGTGFNPVFLGYRVSSDSQLAERLYDKLVSKGLKVWWDVKSLAAGQKWEDGFADGLKHSKVFVPLLSRGALSTFATLTPESNPDNVLLEHLMALEFKLRGDLTHIFPVLVGDLENHPQLGGEVYGDFFQNGCVPQCPDVVVRSLDEKFKAHLQRMGKGPPRLIESDRTVSAILKSILAHTGGFLRGVKRDSTENVVDDIVAVSRLETGGQSANILGDLVFPADPERPRQAAATVNSASGSSQGRRPLTPESALSDIRVFPDPAPFQQQDEASGPIKDASTSGTQKQGEGRSPEEGSRNAIPFRASRKTIVAGLACVLLVGLAIGIPRYSSLPT